MHTFKDVDELIAYVKTNPIEKATVLVKGSNSTHLINVIAYL
jgi:UDP-N-acetylmuramyl pentapeptide synthase